MPAQIQELSPDVEFYEDIRYVPTQWSKFQILTGIWNMYFYTENRATHYSSGIQSDLEVLAIKRFKNGFGIGFVESWIQQVTEDGGALAHMLDGFVGVPSALARLLPT